MTALVTCMLIIIFTLRAMEQAVLWSRKATEAFNWNEHILFVLSRLAIFASFVACSYLSWKEVLFGIICFLPMFFFVHNGVYYETRDHIDGSYPKGFFDKSTTSSAKLPTLGFIARLALFLVGVAGVVLIQLFT
jgi:hypothetical protein